MKLTKSTLKQLIKEELPSALNENQPQPWTIPAKWQGIDRKNQKKLDALRRGKYGKEWTRACPGCPAKSVDGRYRLQLMGGMGEIAIFVHDDRQDWNSKLEEIYVK
jgi:hypothetical protein